MSISFFFLSKWKITFKQHLRFELSKNFSRNFQLRNLTLNWNKSESTFYFTINEIYILLFLHPSERCFVIDPIGIYIGESVKTEGPSENAARSTV